MADFPWRIRRAFARRPAGYFQDVVACGLLGLFCVVLLVLQQATGWGAARTITLPVEEIPASVELVGVGAVERNAAGPFRWTRPQATLLVGLRIEGDYEVTLEVQDSPQNGVPRSLAVSLDGVPVGSAILTGQPRALTFRHVGLRGTWDGPLPPLRIELQTTPYREGGDPRELGVILRGATIRAVPPTPAQWLRQALTVAFILCGLYGVFRAARIRPVHAIVAVASGSAALCLLLALQQPLLPARILAGLVARPALLGAVAVGLILAAGLAWARPTRRAVIAAGLAAPALLQVGLVLWMIWGEPVRVPWWDELFDSRYLWHFYDGQLAWADLWQLYVAHRIVTLRLIHLLVIGVTDWDRRVLLTLQLGVTLLTFVFLALLLWRTVPAPRLRPILVAATGALLFALSQYGHWLLAYGLQFQLVVLGMAAGLWLLSAPETGWDRLALAVAAGWLASWSGLHGLLLWGALLPLVWRAGPAKVGVWVACAALVTGTYAVDFPRSAVERPTPVDLARFTLTNLGAPLGIFQPLAQRLQFWENDNGAIDARWSLLIGVAGAALLGLNLAVAAARRDREFLLRALPWCSLALFAAASAVLTGLGRSSRENAALTSRYHNFAVLWWIALLAIGGLTVWRMRQGRVRWQRPLFAANILALVLGTGAFFEVNLTSAAVALDWHRTLRQAEECARDYTTAPDGCLAVLHPPPVAARLRLGQLAAHRQALYRRGVLPGVAGQRGGSQEAPDLDTLPTMGFQTLYDVDGMPRTLPLIDDGSARLRVPAGAPVILTGWAIDTTALPLAPAAGIFLLVDDQAPLWLPVDGDRPDIAWRFESAYRRSGFRAEWPAGTLTPGNHTVRIVVVAANRRAAYPASPPILLVVE